MIETQPSTDLVKAITACRACGNGDLRDVLDLGVHAVSDFYTTVPDDELRAPLCLVQCGACGLVQLTHSVSKERLYRNYYYRSGTNPAMVAALKDVVDDATSRVDLGLGSIVFDIGANDGTLLSQYPPGLVTLGFEPSQFWKEAVQKGHTVIDGFYPQHRFHWPSALPRVITSIAMFYDLDDPNSFVEAIREDLHPEGVWVNQMMDLDGMLKANAFDNACAEHVAYWDIGHFHNLLAKHTLWIDHSSRNSVNGGSVRTIVRHGLPSYRSGWIPPDFPAFARRIKLLKEECMSFLHQCKKDGKTVLGLGASTKFNTLLQYYGVTPDLLPAIMERNPDKWGRVTAGSHIPIISEEEGRARNPDYFLVGPWHFLVSLQEREATYLANDGHFVVPLPTFRIV